MSTLSQPVRGTAAARPQSLRGPIRLVLALAAGLVVAVLCAAAFGSVGTPPARAVAVAVAACFGLTVVWQRWRFARTRTRLVTGIALLVACYAAAVAVFLVSFDVAFSAAS
ncbi:MAG: hypothetical protein HOQ43_19770 [Glycomyces artemisiae]|uniref:Uncharacterized protein n=1 Tax=Glycomyces artemisiae TaxID=1076443 RepID=A0A850CFJ3_9ACTN|nr:hypothetical protein [Glycomyces artemisiae]